MSTKPKKKQETEPNQPVIASNKFILKSNICESYAVRSIELPKMILKKIDEETQVIKDKSNLGISIHLISHPQDSALAVYTAATRGVKELKILFIDNIGTVKSEWQFQNPRISAVDMGECDYQQNGSPDHPYGLIKVEVEYDGFTIVPSGK